jgi:apolipoprotein N-acyltransferase
VDNGLLTQLAPWTGVYGISFVLMAANALLVDIFLLASERGWGFWHIAWAHLLGGPAWLLVASSEPITPTQRHWRLKALFGGETWRTFGLCITTIACCGTAVLPPSPAPTATAVLIQPNLDVSGDNRWLHPGEWEQHIAEFSRLAGEQCKTYIAGIPQTGAPKGEIVCPPYPTHPDLVVWPESPAPFLETDPRFQSAMRAVASSAQAPLIVGGEGVGFSEADNAMMGYNSALVVGADGARVGRYDKIHLVPFGEYVPFRHLLTFARSLTGNVGEMGRGTEREVFRLNGHRYGVFICYESVFADEVRQFARLGAEVLVNVSDDGWYGDTSAPWQHLNMARMRAIENRRWILRDTNNGVTAVIDPYGRVRQSIPRHQADALPAQFGFREGVTFYTAHGDVFAYLCAMLAMCSVGWSARKLLRQWVAAPSARG